MPFTTSLLTNHGFSLDISHGNAAAAFWVEVDSANVDGQRNLAVARNRGGNHHATSLQLGVHHRATIAFNFLIDERNVRKEGDNKMMAWSNHRSGTATHGSTADAGEAGSTRLATNFTVQAAKAQLSGASTAIKSRCEVFVSGFQASSCHMQPKRSYQSASL